MFKINKPAAAAAAASSDNFRRVCTHNGSTMGDSLGAHVVEPTLDLADMHVMRVRVTSFSFRFSSFFT
jgi:hypothetical protein